MSDSSTPIIIKLGGGVISHSNKIVDYNYLREFRDLLRENIVHGKRFAVILGGGQTMRTYMDHAMQQGNINDSTSLHWIGAAVNTLHAYMVRGFLGDEIAEENVWKFDDVKRLDQLPFNKSVVVVGGFEAGRSGDWVALQVAKALKSNLVIDLKNVDGVYTADPKVDANAKFVEKLSWAEYIDLVGNPEEHQPGANLPVDIFAARESQQLGTSYYILKAADFDAIDAAINGRDFHGSIISDTI